MNQYLSTSQIRKDTGRLSTSYDNNIHTGGITLKNNTFTKHLWIVAPILIC